VLTPTCNTRRPVVYDQNVLLNTLRQFGQDCVTCRCCSGDLNRDHSVDVEDVLDVLIVLRAFMRPGTTGCTRRPQSGELVKFVSTLSTTGVAGHTQYEVGMTINGNVRNIYALAGTHDHVSTVPAAYQVAAPFGVNVGGVDPLFFQMSPTSQFDSWLTMGNGYNAGISTMGSVGINFDGWTETAPLTFDNGAIFLMHPDDATPARTAVSSSGTDVVLAHLTVATGTTWTMTIGKLQGRSLSGQDFQEVDLHFSNS
jgi:hypothetical protein